ACGPGPAAIWAYIRATVDNKHETASPFRKKGARQTFAALACFATAGAASLSADQRRKGPRWRPAFVAASARFDDGEFLKEPHHERFRPNQELCRLYQRRPVSQGTAFSRCRGAIGRCEPETHSRRRLRRWPVSEVAGATGRIGRGLRQGS